MKSKWNLFQLVRMHIATPEEWNAYLKVKDAAPPKPENQRQENFFAINRKRWLEAATPDYRAKYALEQKFIPKIRELFTSEVWIGEGRAVNNSWWEEITKHDWHTQPMNIMENWLGNTIAKYCDLRVWKLEITPQEELIDFVEKCTSVLPHTKIVKQEILALAEKLLNRTIARSTFDRAWRKAELDIEWREPGRKEGKELNVKSTT